MKSKIVAAMAIGVVMGLVTSSSLEQSEAQGPREEMKQEWEYKVVAFFVGENPIRSVDEHQAQIEKLAVEGWEYVGLLSPLPLSDAIVRGGGSVLFKRHKR